jgi:hypothetical protein
VAKSWGRTTRNYKDRGTTGNFRRCCRDLGRAEARWDAELERRGVAAVATALASDGIGIGRGAEFRLFVPDPPNPSRGYVEDWPGHKEARAAARESRRFHFIFWPSVLGAGMGLVAIWPFIRDLLAGGR